jgi:hypothetical protein
MTDKLGERLLNKKKPGLNDFENFIQFNVAKNFKTSKIRMALSKDQIQGSARKAY